MFLTDEQWKWIEPFVRVERNKTGRPRADEQEVFAAILFILHTGTQWRYMPPGFRPRSTVHDYLKLRCGRDEFRALFAGFVTRMFEPGRPELDKGFIDATFAAAKGGAELVGLTRKGKGTKTQLATDAQGVPLAAAVAGAKVGEVQMVQQTMEFLDDAHRPNRMVGDKAYDSDPLDIVLEDLGIEMISPYRKNRRPENRTPDGRKLKVYKHRWIVERTIAWLTNHRRLMVRHEQIAGLFIGLFNLGCFMIALKMLPGCLL